MAGKSIEISFDLSFQRALVWQALTDPKALSLWLMETDFAPVSGQKFRFIGKPSRGWRGWIDGQVVQATVQERLSFSWHDMPAHDITWVSYDLEDMPGGTRVVLRHEGFNGSHGFLSGLFLRRRIGADWRSRFGRIGDILNSLRSTGDLAQAPKLTDDASWFRTRHTPLKNS